MLFNNLILILSAFLFCFLLTPILANFAAKRGLVSRTTSKKIDQRRIPYLGGVSIFLIFFILSILSYLLFSFNLPLTKIIAFLFASLIIVLFGLYDDIKELKPVYKLIGQTVAASIIVTFVVKMEVIYLSPILNMIMTFFWIILIINAINLLDIIDGLAGVISLINLITLFIFAYFTNNYFVNVTSTILIGVLCAFLYYNLPPAKIFMGDAGSQFLGLTQATLAILISYAQAGKEIGIVIPVVILAVPIFDLFFVSLMRLKQKKSIFLKSNDHFVFRMLKISILNKKILLIMFLISVLTNICALLIYRVSNIIGAIIFSLIMLMLLVIGFKLSRLEMN